MERRPRSAPPTDPAMEPVTSVPEDSAGAGCTARSSQDTRSAQIAAAVAACLATAQWLVFRPGILTPDTVFQYREAVTGQFTNVHPPLMALVFAAGRRIGVGLGTLMWLQAFTLHLGILLLARTVLRRVVGNRRPGLTGPMLGAALLVASPLLSPCMFYGATFWKDVWLAIALLFAAVAYLRLVDRAEPRRPFDFAVLMGLTAVVPSLRHNAIVILPALAWLVWHGAPVRDRRLCLLLTTASMLVALAMPRVLNRLARARDADPVGQVLALDLVGLWKAHPECRPSLPHVKANVRADLVDTRYHFGHVAQLLWSEPIIVEPGMFDREPLHAQWWRAWREFPLPMLEMKLRAFWPLLGLDQRLTHYWIEHGQWAEDLGLRHEGWAGAREAVLRFGDKLVARQKTLRWVGRVHGVWLAVALGLWVCARRLGARAAGFAGVAALALAYYGGFLLASVMPDYRFMFPATLLVQVVVVSTALGALLRRSAGRAAHAGR
ncbi:MAG: hypothetical protein R3F56_13420 [Planctomycetota bacterium]